MRKLKGFLVNFSNLGGKNDGKHDKYFKFTAELEKIDNFPRKNAENLST
jgi:hypothetical protein